MEDTKDLPKEEMRKQYRSQAFQQKQGSGSKSLISIKSATEKHELDHIADNTNKWSTALRRTNTLQLAWARGWISSLQMEHELANLATKLGLECWIKRWQGYNQAVGI